MRKITALIVSAAALTSCYEPFVKDYDYCSAYFGYQYDMRTFVVGEKESFDVTVCLGGVMQNKMNRSVAVKVDNDLVTEDLSKYAPEGTVIEDAFTAYDIFTGTTPPFGTIFGNYTVTDFRAGKMKVVKALPSSFYTVEGLAGMTIKEGEHTAVATVKPTEDFFSNSRCTVPYYALGFRLMAADVDSLVAGKNFEIIVVRCENRFYGNWYHGGKSVTKDAAGNVVSTDEYPFSIPQTDDKIYTLTTDGPYSVTTDKYIQKTGALKLSFDGDSCTISSDAVTLVPDGRTSGFNGAKLLQDRELYLNYTVRNEDGGTTEVTDTLYFRNRVRDGVSEWRSEDAEDYN